MTRPLFFLTMIVTMTVVGCGGGNGGGPVANSLPIDLIATQAPDAAQSTPNRGSVTQTSNTIDGVTTDTIRSTPRLQGSSLQATVNYNNGATTLDSSNIVESYFDLSRRVCQSCGTSPSGTSTQWRHVSLEQEDSNGTVYSIVFSDIESNSDTDYLSAGIWMYVPEGAVDSTDLDDVVYGTFAGGSTQFSQANLQDLTGNATYEGDAMGLYTEGTSDTLEGGLFNATVALTANFGDDSLILGTINGSVTNFSGTNAVTNRPFPFQGTTLNLGEADIGNFAGGFFTGATSGSHQGETYSGRWGGEFLGNESEPTSVTGTFGAENNNASNRRTFMGVFGAYQQ